MFIFRLIFHLFLEPKPFSGIPTTTVFIWFFHICQEFYDAPPNGGVRPARLQDPPVVTEDLIDVPLEKYTREIQV